MKNQKNLGLIYTFILFISFSFNEINAQTIYSVTGKVMGNNEPLIGANVLLKESNNDQNTLGTSTDVNGIYHIQVPKGNYSLEIYYIGYTTYVSNVEVKGNVSLPPITLIEDTQLMNEVVVTARTITYNANGYVAEISKNAFYKNKDMSNILRLTPGTNVTPHGIEAYGGGISKVYINNRELKLNGEQLVNYLQTIEGKNVKEMEVVITSGVEDDAASSGQAILKITTLNPETGGLLSIGGTGGFRMNTQVYGGNMNLQWRMNKHWGMYLNFSSIDTQTTNGTKTETVYYGTSERRENEMVTDTERSNYNGTLGFTYDLDSNNLFSIEGNYMATPSSNSQWNDTRHWDNNRYNLMSHGTASGERDFSHLNLSFLYLHKFGKNGELTFKSEAFNNRVDEDEQQAYQYTTENQSYIRLNEEDNWLYTLKADYTHQFPKVKGKLSAGMKVHWLTNDNYTDYLASINDEQDLIGSYDDKYKYSEDIYALYAKYSFTWKKFAVNAGLRMEHSVLSPESVTNPERNEKNNYTDLFPEIGISYTINKEKGHNISLTYNKGIRRPSISGLNPLVRHINEYNYSMGNPSLKPYYTHNVSWTTHLFHKYIIRMYYDYSDNGFIYISENKGGNIYSTQYNGNEHSYFRIYGSAPIQIGKNVRLTFSAGYSYRNTSYKDDQTTYSSWNVGCSGMFNLPGGIDIIADFAYLPPSKSLYGKTYTRPFGNLFVTKSFWEGKLNMTLLAGDLFDQNASRRIEYRYDTFYQETKGIKKNYGVVLRVGYNLRWGQKSSVKKAGSSSDSGRFAAE